MEIIKRAYIIEYENWNRKLEAQMKKSWSFPKKREMIRDKVLVELKEVSGKKYKKMAGEEDIYNEYWFLKFDDKTTMVFPYSRYSIGIVEDHD